MAFALSDVFAPHPLALVIAVAADLALGDPVYRFHPVRLMGGALTLIESGLRRVGADGYGEMLMDNYARRVFESDPDALVDDLTP